MYKLITVLKHSYERFIELISNKPYITFFLDSGSKALEGVAQSKYYTYCLMLVAVIATSDELWIAVETWIEI